MEAMDSKGLLAIFDGSLELKCIPQPFQILLQFLRSLIPLRLNLLQRHAILVPPVLDSSDDLLAVSDDVAFKLGDDVVMGDLKDVLLALLGGELLLPSVQVLEQGIEEFLLLFAGAAQALFDGVVVGQFSLDSLDLLKLGGNLGFKVGEFVLERGRFGEERLL